MLSCPSVMEFFIHVFQNSEKVGSEPSMSITLIDEYNPFL